MNANTRPALTETLPQYAKDPRSKDRRRIRGRVMGTVIAFCFVYGFMFAVLAPYLILPFAVPLVFLGGLVVWALPEMRAAPTRTLEWLFFVYFGALVLWPNYLAIAVPGLPWITVIRLTGFPLVIIFMLCISISDNFRQTISRSLAASPLQWRLLAFFCMIQLISIVFSKQIGSSIQKFIVDQINWTAIFFISTYIFSRPKKVEQWVYSLWAFGLILGVIGVIEARLGRLPWAGYIPSFLKIQDEGVQRIMTGAARAARGDHRVQTTYGTPLGLAEYIALIMPFVVNFAFGSYKIGTRVAATLSVPFLFVIVLLSQCRLGVVGCLLTMLVFILAFSLRLWRRNKQSIFGPAISLAYPVLFVAAMGMVFAVGRLHKMVLGGGAEQFSTQDRLTQWHMGMPMILQHPWGYGIGMGAEALGFLAPNGTLTIDSYYLDIALEFGIVGFIVFFAMIGYSAYLGGRTVLEPEHNDKEQAFLVPLAISLINFFIIKSVFSQEDNNPLIFMMMGAITALVGRRQLNIQPFQSGVRVWANRLGLSAQHAL